MKYYMNSKIVYTGLLFSQLMIGSTTAQSQNNIAADYVIKQSLVPGAYGSCPEVISDDASNNSQFENSVCLWHKYREGLDNRVLVEDNIRTMQVIQTEGLPSTQQAITVLLEGLSHCQLARMDQPVNPEDSVRLGRFCEQRLHAINSLSSVPWRFANFTYADGVEGASMEMLIDELAQCYSENQPLDSSFDGTCGFYQGISDARQLEVIDSEYEKVELKHFGSTSKINTLFVNKSILANSISSQSQAKFDELSEKADNIAEHTLTTEQALAQLTSGLDSAFTSYREAYATANAVLSRLEDWQRGLLIKKNSDGTETDYALPLQNSATILGAELNSLLTELEVIDDSLEKMSTTADPLSAQNKAFRDLCSVFFCQIYPIHWYSSGSADYYSSVCAGSTMYNHNALCRPFVTQVSAGGSTKDFRQFCADAGFDSQFMPEASRSSNIFLSKDAEGSLICQNN